MEPQSGKLFCKKHADELQKAGIPDNLLGFARKINREEVIEAMDSTDANVTDYEHILEDILKRVTYRTGDPDLNTADAQGTNYILIFLYEFSY